jgi:hypothetical protein
MAAGAALLTMWARSNFPESVMSLPKFPSLPSQQEGKAGYILMWLLGVPIPILLLIFLLRGCN